MDFALIIKQAGGATALSRLTGIQRSTIAKWARSGIPAERVPAFSAATGIPRHELRPTLWEPPQPAKAE